MKVKQGFMLFDIMRASLYRMIQFKTLTTLQVTNYPTLLFYPAGDKSKPVRKPRPMYLISVLYIFWLGDLKPM